ncbi:putative rhamnogalacturonase B [Aspergillus saccharolyticus JOP 1030-1]|uniref:Galactose-binding like protein n=1 Tax=Aspergillus saccharolyticus JOP 1030-1 TaxID=1450539 RepID=A0A318ZI57_9EURO|nr:galactose-binding like protein [Aspergillus saccharolyticus JOP 1030-1]PYH47179.1 galactose-binding like protein [Aspergillus saccharolyticus JOP 1030-1]
MLYSNLRSQVRRLPSRPLDVCSRSNSPSSLNRSSLLLHTCHTTQADEYAVATSSVTVTADSTTTKNISGSVKTGTTIFEIGEWDAQPTGFRNAANQLRMHPSDSRMSSWGPLTYTIGSSALADFPMAVFKSVNNTVTIKFTATSSLRPEQRLCGLGRHCRLPADGPRRRFSPFRMINNYTGSAPAAPTNLDSRGVTRGAYRGLGEVYDVSIPSGTIVAGTNTITINVISGSSGDTESELYLRLCGVTPIMGFRGLR